MENEKLKGGITEYSISQTTLLVILRVLIGWHFLYEGIVKLMNPNWSSIGYLLDSQGYFADFFNKMAMNPNLLNIIDTMNIWGLIAIGLGLILGVFTNISAVAGFVLLIFYYMSHPALADVKYAIPSEGDYLYVNKTLIEAFALLVLLVFPTGRIIGIDRLIFGRKKPVI